MVTEVHESPSSPPHSLVATEDFPPADNKAKEEMHKQRAELSTATPTKTTKTTPFSENITSGTEDIIISDQDVLFGRGGLTNRHRGNLRYRDFITLHRDDYVQSSKIEKPKVALRIVKAIKSGPSPGRFLKRGGNGKWYEVSDKEASWKASQALREKTRWSCMKENSSSNMKCLAKNEDINNKSVSGLHNRLKKRKVEENFKTEALEETNIKFQNSESQPRSSKPPQIVIPVVAKVDNYIVKKVKELPSGKKIPLQIEKKPATKQVLLIEQNITPRNEDVLFGRGGRTNHHPGNIRLREVVKQYQEAYRLAKKIDKPKISKLIVAALRTANPPSRFLRWNEQFNQWVDVGDRRATEKVSQTLREKERGNKGGSEGSGRTPEPGCYWPAPSSTSPPASASQNVATPSHGPITATKPQHSQSSTSSQRFVALSKPPTTTAGSMSSAKQAFTHSSPEDPEDVATPACMMERHVEPSVNPLISVVNVDSKSTRDANHAPPESLTSKQRCRASPAKVDAKQASSKPAKAGPLSPIDAAVSLPQYTPAFSSGKLDVKNDATPDSASLGCLSSHDIEPRSLNSSTGYDSQTKQNAKSALSETIASIPAPIGDEGVSSHPESAASTTPAAASPSGPSIHRTTASLESQPESSKREIKHCSTPSDGSWILV